MNLISPSHYSDVVEERSILKICGYPNCSEPLKNAPKQHFQISTRTNQVFDLKERKMFCSNACFKSSNYLKEQINSTPVWLREKKDLPQIKFLEDDSVATKNEHERLQTNRIAFKENRVDYNSTFEGTEKNNASANPEKAEMATTAKPKSSTKKSVAVDVNILELVMIAMKNWWTSKSTDFIKGEEKLEEVSSAVTAISEEVSLVKLTDDLRKVDAYFKGATFFDHGDFQVIEKETSEKQPILPVLDKNAQIALRRKIMLQQIERSFSGIEPVLDAKWSEVKVPIKDLVKTFKLTPKNIILRQIGWMLVCIFILHALAMKDKNIHMVLQRPAVKLLIEELLKNQSFSQLEVEGFVETLIEP